MIDHREARELYDYAIEADETNRDEAMADLRFRAGEQWPDAARVQRENEGRPALVMNVTGQYIRRVTGAIRQQPPSIKVLPADDVASVAEEAKRLATIKEGMLRAIEHRSRGRWQYISAVENAATCGIGHLRVLTEYDERDPFRQEIRFASVSDALAVVYDPDAKRLTKEDGMYAFVTGTMSPKAFKLKYPKARGAQDWGRDEREAITRHWTAPERVRVVEMFRRDPFKRKLIMFSDGAKIDVTKAKPDAVAAMVADAALAGVTVAAERDWTDYKVFRSVMSGAEYLEDEVEFPSRHIPLVPVVGEEISVGETRIRHGLMRFMRDPQRLYNYWRTAAVEQVALAPRAPFMATAAQIGPYKALWDTMHVTPRPYLLYQPDPDAPTAMPTRATQPEPPSAMWTESRLATEDLKAVTGIYDASLGAQGNETSGRAIMARQREGDVGTFLYVDNLRHSVERLGVILLDMLPKVYDTERVVAVMEENGDAQMVPINAATPDGGVENPMEGGAYEIKVSTGPTWQSRQEETAAGVTALIQAVPGIFDVAGDILIENLNFPRADEIAARLKAKMAEADAMRQAAMQAGPPEPGPKERADAVALVARADKDEASAVLTRAQAEAQALANLARINGFIPPI